ncbi:hypothetical protein RhiJN_09988 [Ceratobasidium sp. AG-Ba]|nr:hypothetical protein RhiJN_09988 [Ceratobasidium sp. AG-Ba]QRW10754.1 hypothetical protein RhiLY_09753 [Ceratobasidium sp. AG-Ba]
MYFAELAKYLVFTILACLDNSTYVGMAAIDVGARAIYASAYVDLGRAGLQLPVGAFVPPPPLFTTGSLMLYVTPATVASWPSVVDALYDAPKALDIGFHTVRHVGATLAAHHQRLAPSLLLIPPPFLSATQSSYVSVRWSRHAGSLPALSSTAYRQLTFPSFNLTSSSSHHEHCPIPVLTYSSTLLDDILLGLSPTDRRAPYSAAIGLGQCTPRRVLPIQQDLNTSDMELEDVERFAACETPVPPELERSTQVVAYEFSSSSDQDDQTTDSVIIIHLRSCLIALFSLCCALVIVFVVLRRILHLFGWIYSSFPITDYFPGDLLLAWVVVRLIVGVCALRKAKRAAPIDSNVNSDTDVPPPSSPHPSSAIEAASTHVPFVASASPSTPTAQSALAEPAKKKKKNKKKKKKAGLRSAVVVDPVKVPLPADDGKSWTVSPTMVPLPLPPPHSPLPDTDIPPLCLPPPVLGTDPSSGALPEHSEDRTTSSPATSMAPQSVTPPSAPLLVGVSSVSPVETAQVDSEQRAESPKGLPTPIDAPFAPPSEQTGVMFATASESGEDDGGDWTVVERKRKPRQAPGPILGAASTRGFKKKRGRGAGQKPEGASRA